MGWLFARHLRPFVPLAGAASLALNVAPPAARTRLGTARPAAAARIARQGLQLAESELQELARVSFDLAPEPRETAAEALAVSGRRLSYLLMLWGAVAIAYAAARALLA